jgi:hypothetical protein
VDGILEKQRSMAKKWEGRLGDMFLTTISGKINSRLFLLAPAAKIKCRRKVKRPYKVSKTL